MKLDNRIIDGKKPLTCFDTEEARKFKGEQGYFSDNPLNFAYGDMALSKTTVLGKLRLNEDNLKYPFLNTTNSINYRFFLPVAWLKPEEPEKKWRSFSLTEWQHDYDIGEEIIFRLKKSDTVRVYEYCGYISDSNDDSPGKGVINLGGELFVLQNLFDLYELREDNDWQPFGVEVEE